MSIFNYGQFQKQISQKKLYVDFGEKPKRSCYKSLLQNTARDLIDKSQNILNASGTKGYLVSSEPFWCHLQIYVQFRLSPQKPLLGPLCLLQSADLVWFYF